MTPHTQQFLETNRPAYDMLINAGIMNLNPEVKQGMLDAMREFSPNYHTTLWCSTCVVELVKQVYQQYDAYLETNKTKKIE